MQTEDEAVEQTELLLRQCGVQDLASNLTRVEIHLAVQLQPPVFYFSVLVEYLVEMQLDIHQNFIFLLVDIPFSQEITPNEI